MNKSKDEKITYYLCFMNDEGYGRELPPKVPVSLFYSYYTYFFILLYIHTCKSLYFFLYPCFSNFTLIILYSYVLLNSMLQYSLLILVNFYIFILYIYRLLQYYYTYLYYKCEFNHANYKAHSIKTNSSCTLIIHYSYCLFTLHYIIFLIMFSIYHASTGSLKY